MMRAVNLFIFFPLCYIFANSVTTEEGRNAGIVDRPDTSIHAFSSLCEIIGRKNQTDITHEVIRHLLFAYSWLESLLVLASNYPFSNADIEKEMQIVVMASTNLLDRLFLMEEVNNILYSSAYFVIHEANITENSTKEDVREAGKKIIEKIEKTILANATLATFYAEEKSKFAESPYQATSPAATAIEGNTNTSVKANPRFYALDLRERIMNDASQECFEHVILKNELQGNEAKSLEFQRLLLSTLILRLAKTTKINHIQKLFDEAVRETVELFQSDTDPNVRIADIFYAVIEDKFESNRELEDELISLRSYLTKKYNVRYSCTYEF